MEFPGWKFNRDDVRACVYVRVFNRYEGRNKAQSKDYLHARIMFALIRINNNI